METYGLFLEKFAWFRLYPSHSKFLKNVYVSMHLCVFMFTLLRNKKLVFEPLENGCTYENYHKQKGEWGKGSVVLLTLGKVAFFLMLISSYF